MASWSPWTGAAVMADDSNDQHMDLERLSPGRLLVANPELPDPNFDRTVVLLLGCGDEGALGVVLNRPSDTLLAAPLPGLERLAADPAVVFVGGPVQLQAVICLARSEGPQELSGGWNPFMPEVGTLDLGADGETLSDSVTEVRVFAGYAGWGAGQLESELAAGAWWVFDAAADDVFSDEPELLWKRVLRRQGGRLALVSAYPADPMLN
jgi:putative transcriptional regulator